MRLQNPKYADNKGMSVPDCYELVHDGFHISLRYKKIEVMNTLASEKVGNKLVFISLSAVVRLAGYREKY